MKPDFTLICIDEGCECVLWKDMDNGLIYRDFHGNDYLTVAADELGLLDRARDLIDVLGLLDE